MSQKTIDALTQERKFIAWKIEEIQSRLSFLIQKQNELVEDLEKLSVLYNRNTVLLDTLATKGLVSEFGSSQPVRFADPTNCFVRDENGDELMCACGKKSVILVAGKESFTAMCHACREKLNG